MHLKPVLLAVAVITSLLAACHAGLAQAPSDATQQPTLEALADAMDAIAKGESTVSRALEPLVPLPSPGEARPPADARTAGFVDPRGHAVREIEIRTRLGGVDSSRLVLARVEPEPCAGIQALSARVGATETFRIPPSPHAPTGTPGTLGYTAEYPDGGKLMVAADTDAPDCITLITARQPLARARRYEDTPAG